MHNSKKISTKKLVLTALLAALTVVGSAIRVTMPVDIAGNTAFHLGNIMCALSGLLLGPWFGGLAAGLGSAIYDIMNPLYISECWMTFLMKGAYGLLSGLVMWTGINRTGYIKSIFASAAGAITYALLYLAKTYFYKGLLLSGLSAEAAWYAVIAKIPATVFNGAVAIIFAPILFKAIRTARDKNHLSLD